MPKIIGKVFVFLWVAVWGKINVWQFLTLNKHYLILVSSNILLSLLFIYMTEQVVVRTDQYRQLKQENAVFVKEREEHELYKLEMDAKINTLKKAFGLTKVELDASVMLKEYEAWAKEVERLDDLAVFNRPKPKGVVTNGEPPKTK